MSHCIGRDLCISNFYGSWHFFCLLSLWSVTVQFFFTFIQIHKLQLLIEFGMVTLGTQRIPAFVKAIQLWCVDINYGACDIEFTEKTTVFFCYLISISMLPACVKFFSSCSSQISIHSISNSNSFPYNKLNGK